MLDYSCERHKLSPTESIAYIGNHKGLAVGNGMVFYLMHLVPIVGWMLAPSYAGAVDKASHAYNNRRTIRTEVMFGEPGTAYVYLCYGIHHLFNVVTNKKNIPHAILIRAVEPLTGIETMLLRTGKPKADFTLTRGPGNVSKALGIFTRHTGYDLCSEEIFIADDGLRLKPKQIITTTRIGVDYAAEDSLLPYRFIVKDNPYVSGKRK